MRVNWTPVSPPILYRGLYSYIEGISLEKYDVGIGTRRFYSYIERALQWNCETDFTCRQPEIIHVCHTEAEDLPTPHSHRSRRVLIFNCIAIFCDTFSKLFRNLVKLYRKLQCDIIWIIPCSQNKFVPIHISLSVTSLCASNLPSFVLHPQGKTVHCGA